MRAALMAKCGLALACCAMASVAQARPARCVTTDEGAYRCNFRPTGRDGSFEVSAPGKPTYLLNMDEPGYAFGFVTIGGRNIALPGRYRAIGGPQGCWVNDETKAKICAE